MKFKNEVTGDVLEVPPPNQMGESVILLNGKIVERVFYADDPPSITLDDGRRFKSGGEFAAHVVGLLATTPEQRSEIDRWKDKK